MHVYWPGVAIGLIVGFYWARVIKLVLKTRRDVGKAANFVPPELLGRILRIIWYPNVAAWIAIAFLAGLLKRPPYVLTPLIDLPILAWAAVVVAFLALWGTMICWRKMGRSWRMGIDPNEKTQLVFSGAYSYVRHPIYALQCLLAVASLIAVPVPAMIPVAAIQCFFLQWEARREEKYLVQTHGSAYSTYMQNVGRFLPKRVSAYVP